jgi:hypothetical protein
LQRLKYLLKHTSETNETFTNIRFATYVYRHSNICNIQIKHLQHTSKTVETFETYNCNMRI